MKNLHHLVQKTHDSGNLMSSLWVQSWFFNSATKMHIDNTNQAMSQMQHKSLWKLPHFTTQANNTQLLLQMFRNLCYGTSTTLKHNTTHSIMTCHISHITKTNNCSQTLWNKFPAPFNNGPNKYADCPTLINKNHNILAFIAQPHQRLIFLYPQHTASLHPIKMTSCRTAFETISDNEL